KPAFQGSASNMDLTGLAPRLKANSDGSEKLASHGKGGYAKEKRNTNGFIQLKDEEAFKIKPNQVWIPLRDLARVAPEYLGEHLRYALGASLFTGVTPVENLEWNYPIYASLYPDFISEAEVPEWVEGGGPILLQHKTEPDEHPKLEFIHCKGPDFEWSQPIIRLPQWKLEEDSSIEGHDMAVAVRANRGGKMCYLMRIQKEVGVEKPLVSGALFSKMNEVQEEPLWGTLKDRIMNQAVKEPMDGSRLSGWRYLAAIEMSEVESQALEIPSNYMWLDESQIAHLLKKGDLHDGFLESSSLFKLESAKEAS